MRIHAGLLDALHDRSAQVVNPLRAAKRPRRREALTFFDHVELSGASREGQTLVIRSM